MQPHTSSRRRSSHVYVNVHELSNYRVRILQVGPEECAKTEKSRMEGMIPSILFRSLNLDPHLRLNHGDVHGSGEWESPGFS